MRKKTPPLKLVVPLLAFLVMIGSACVGQPASALASSLRNFGAGPGSTSCVGNNNNGMPNSDCSTNTPFPSPGSCQLAWTDGGGGTVALDVSGVSDQGLQSTLAGYNLRCAADITATSCALVNNSSGNTMLDLANMINRSPWIYRQLNSGQYTLMCNGTTTNSVLETIQPNSNYSFQVTTPCCTTRFLSYHDNDLLGYTDVVDSGSSTSLRQDTTFKIVPGLAGTAGVAGSNCYSFESLSDANKYLRHSNYRIHMDANDGSLLFKDDATFCAMLGLSRTGVSFHALKFPDRYIRHINAQLWISNNGGQNPWDNPNSYTNDVTWNIVAPLAS